LAAPDMPVFSFDIGGPMTPASLAW